MSTEYWAIQGIGLKIERELFDWKKCLGFIKANFELDSEDIDEVTEETFEEFLDSTEIYYEGLIEAIIEDFGNKHIGYISGCNSDMGDFILFFPGYPWSYEEDDFQLTEEKAIELIYECIQPYLKDTISKAEILEKIDHVSTYGCG